MRGFFSHVVPVILVVSVCVAGCIMSASDRMAYKEAGRRLHTYAPQVVALIEAGALGSKSSKELLSMVNTAMENYAQDYAKMKAIEASETPWWEIALAVGGGILTFAAGVYGDKHPMLTALASLVRPRRAGSPAGKGV